MRRGFIHLIIIIIIILGFAAMLLLPLGIISIVLTAFCFAIAIFLLYKTKGGWNNETSA